MDLLGVGPLELIFVLLIIFLVLGPDDLTATGKKIGRFLSTVRKSEFWRGVNQITREMRTLPTTLMREAELEDAKKELEESVQSVKNISKEFNTDEIAKIEKEIQQELDPENKILPDLPPPTQTEATPKVDPNQQAAEPQQDAASPEPEESRDAGEAPEAEETPTEEGED